ncbi:hypothetical protein ASD65_06365 [Microbacterium sp. Root61]|uniref:nuclear transport factor 2 family protein n=1 Tax=Microbacterium sp. Root61 TaxID=1736570 RepID=UPI0006FEC19F|nr:nuclear transport factor 2 family protein [Microbacterium sp. Root61]KRA24089.1 hypothetical protein ASD65_06365 [Microbacterium sp. Root61]
MSNAADFLQGYLAAWRTNDHDSIRALFAPDAVYRSRPHDPDPAVGHDRIVALWDEEQDAPDEWSYEGAVDLETPDAAAIRGVTTYTDGAKASIYDNLWLVRFDAEGRATEFTDWWVLRKV